MDHRLIEGLMEVIAPLVKEYVEKQVAPLRAELAEYKARAPEKGEPGKDADPTAVAALVLEQVRPGIDAAVKGAVEAIPPVQVDPELVRLAAGDLVHKAVPPPEHVASMVEQAVEARMALIEPPRDGKDADMGAVFAEIERRFQEIPTPRDGRDSDPAEVERMVDAAVTKAMAAVPTPKDGEPGKDADPEHVEMLVRLVVGEEIGKIEPPRDGKDADMDAVAEIVRARVDEAVAAIRVPEDGKSVTVDDVRPVLEELVAAIPPAPAGKDADVDAVLRAVDERVSEKVAEAVSSIRVPEDGKSVTVEDVRPMIEEVVKAAVAEIPVPVNGKDADPAEVAALILDDVVKLIPPGRDGTSVTVEDVAPMLEQLVEKRVSAIPPAPAGKDGRDGKDGVGMAGGLIGRNGELILTLSDGSTRDVGVIVGKDGAPGQPGRDGLGFDDLTVEYDGERTITLRYARDEVVKEVPIKMPIVLDRGVYRETSVYEKGDGCSFGGSFWIAQRDNPDGKPQDGNKSWRLAVKRGKNGADGAPPKGPIGPVSVPGAKSK